MLEIVYSGQKTPEILKKSIFLAGPSPRNENVKSWRPDFIKELESQGFDGVVFNPEFAPNTEYTFDYDKQIAWEQKHRAIADIIVFWIPRDENLPGFTTNIEFGLDLPTGKVIYGRPDSSPKNSYLDYIYRQSGDNPHNNIKTLIHEVIERIGEGVERSGGERFIPLHVWETKQFQSWYQAQKSAGNVLEEAKVLWSYNSFCHAVLAKIWVEKEQRYVETDFVFSRPDISVVFAYYYNFSYLGTEVVMVKEYRNAVRNNECYVLELPGGSGYGDAKKVAIKELVDETGLEIDESRFVELDSKQFVSTLSSHHAHLFAVELTKEEIDGLKKLNDRTFGENGTLERCYVDVKTLNEILHDDLVDFGTLGMIMKGNHHIHRTNLLKSIAESCNNLRGYHENIADDL